MKKLLQLFFTLLLFILCFQNKTNAQCWKDGDFTSYDQSAWGDLSTVAASNLNANYSSVYTSTLGLTEVGIPGSGGFSMQFETADAVTIYLPSIGTPGVLDMDLLDPTTSVSGQFGGDVLALKLNIDFSDAGYLSGNAGIKFGDLVIYGLTSDIDLNGLTVRQFLDIVNTALGGGSTTDPISDLDAIAININNSFSAGTASTFAQQHLKKGWKSGDFTSYGQVGWITSPGSTALSNQFANIYPSGVAIGGKGGNGGIYAVSFTSAQDVLAYLPQNGDAKALAGNLLNPTSTTSGIFGGDVLALQLDVDFAEANALSQNSGLKFGNLVLYNLTTNEVGDDISALNGLTVWQVLSTANSILGGGISGLSLTDPINDLDEISAILSLAFINGSPSAWAQLHLKRGWQIGDLTTYVQAAWASSGSASNVLLNKYNTVYASLSDVFRVGSSSGYQLTFSGVESLQAFFPQTASQGVLTGNLLDPTSSASGSFGGDVAALKLNIDFSDAGFISGNSGLKFGDLTICGLSSNTSLNGMTVRQVLDIANSVLGTTSTSYTATDLDALVANLDVSFAGGVTVSQWAQLHLVNGSCDCGNTVTNHCPTATAINISTTVGSAVKFILQGSDADNNTLTYTISQSPTHGTAVIAGGDSILYTPAAAYHGTDQLKYTVSDGQCSAEAVVNITVVVCPGGQGYWKNNQSAWPVSSLMLGTNSYSKSQLITILNTPIGNGNNADASLILADQLIGAKLSLLNGSPDPGHLADSIAAADALIGSGLIPMKVKANSVLGKKMILLAAFFSNYNNGVLTQGCTQPLITKAEITSEVQEIPGEYKLENYPNPFSHSTVIRYQLPVSSHVQLKIYDVVGKEVATLVDEMEDAGIKTVQFNAGNFSAGVYYYRLSAGEFSQVKKMILVK